MSAVSFSKSNSGATPVAKDVQVAPAPAEARANVPVVAPRPATPATVFDDAPIDFKDIIVPRLNIVQRVGKLSTKFTPGDVLFAENIVIPRPFELIVMGFGPKSYVERTGSNDLGRMVATPELVEQAGGTLNFQEAEDTGKPLFQTLIKAILLIKKPDALGDVPLFHFDLGGGKYALASWNLKGSSYTHAAKVFFTARKTGVPMNLTGGYHHGQWSLDTKLGEYRTGNVAIIPVLKPAGETSPEVRSAIERILASN